jgi:catechol 2,3-dioxygenase
MSARLATTMRAGKQNSALVPRGWSGRPLRLTPCWAEANQETAMLDTLTESLVARPAVRPIVPGARIGHVHLKVADLQRALDFYCGVLGFTLMQRYGVQAAFISAGGYHHHIGLNTWESLGGSPPPPGSTGLFHTAVLYPSRADLADALRRLIAAGVSPDGASDHGVSEALYLRDPDQNGVELYWDRPEAEWPRTPEGGLAMFTRRLDIPALLAEPELA